MAKENKEKKLKEKKVKKEKIKQEKYRTEEQTEIIRFIWILVIVIVLIVGVYFATRIFVTKDLLNNEETDNDVVEGSINYNVTLIGAMLNKPEEEYYVIIYDTENLRSVYYSSLVNNYIRNEEHLKVYHANLSNELNAKFYDPENITTQIDSIADLKVGDITLIRVRNSALQEILTEEESIATALAYINEEDTEN